MHTYTCIRENVTGGAHCAPPALNRVKEILHNFERQQRLNIDETECLTLYVHSPNKIFSSQCWEISFKTLGNTRNIRFEVHSAVGELEVKFSQNENPTRVCQRRRQCFIFRCASIS